METFHPSLAAQLDCSKRLSWKKNFTNIYPEVVAAVDVAVVTVAVAEASLPAEAAAEVAAAAVTVAVEVLAVAVVLLEAEEVPVAEPVEARAVEPRLSLSRE